MDNDIAHEMILNLSPMTTITHGRMALFWLLLERAFIHIRVMYIGRKGLVIALNTESILLF